MSLVGSKVENKCNVFVEIANYVCIQSFHIDKYRTIYTGSFRRKNNITVLVQCECTWTVHLNMVDKDSVSYIILCPL